MNKILKFDKWVLQYWIEEFPNLSSISSYKSCEVIRNSKNISIVKESKICIELRRLYLDASNYGLLGIEFKPNRNSSELNIEIQYNKNNLKKYYSKINYYYETTYCGMPEECVPYLKSKIIEMIYQQNIFFGGSLIVSCAANSEVGSSPAMFSRVAEIIIKIFKEIQENTVLDFDDCVASMFTKQYGVKLKSVSEVKSSENLISLDKLVCIGSKNGLRWSNLMQKKIEKLINENIEKSVFFTGGTSEAKVQKVENLLNVYLPESYKWFLKKYGDGSLYGVWILGWRESDKDIPVVRQTIYFRNLGLPSNFIVVENCYEWIYCINCGDGKVYRWSPWVSKFDCYYNDFYDFLITRLSEAKQSQNEYG